MQGSGPPCCETLGDHRIVRPPQGNLGTGLQPTVHFFKVYFYSMHVNVCLHVHMCIMYVPEQGIGKPEEGIGSSGTRVAISCKLPCGFWN